MLNTKLSRKMAYKTSISTQRITSNENLLTQINYTMSCNVELNMIFYIIRLHREGPLSRTNNDLCSKCMYQTNICINVNNIITGVSILYDSVLVRLNSKY